MPAPPVRQAAANVEIAPSEPPKSAVELVAAPVRKAAGEPIGLAIGKPVRKRSLLGRLFGR